MNTEVSHEAQRAVRTTPIAWRKSSRSGSGGGGSNCVEAGACNCHGVAIRDTKHHASGTLTITNGEWLGLLAVLKGA